MQRFALLAPIVAVLLAALVISLRQPDIRPDPRGAPETPRPTADTLDVEIDVAASHDSRSRSYADILEGRLNEGCNDADFANAIRSSSSGEKNESSPTLFETIDAAAESLGFSNDPDQQLVAALLTRDRARKLKLLVRGLDARPNDPMLVYFVSLACGDNESDIGCPIVNLEERLETMNSHNAEAWIHVATNYYSSGDADAALAALWRAATAAEANNYWVDVVELIERGLEAGSEHPFPTRAGMSIGAAAINLPSYAARLDMCHKAGAENDEWANACLEYGKILESQSNTEIAYAIGLDLKVIALQKLDDEVALTRAIEKQIAYRNRWRALISSDAPILQLVMFLEPALFHRYLSAVRAEGEIAAMPKLREESRRWIEQNPEKACGLDAYLQETGDGSS